MCMDLMRGLRSLSESDTMSDHTFYSTFEVLNHVPSLQRALVREFTELLIAKATLDEPTLLLATLKVLLAED